jgi:hypothetical protein
MLVERALMELDRVWMTALEVLLMYLGSTEHAMELSSMPIDARR